MLDVSNKYNNSSNKDNSVKDEPEESKGKEIAKGYGTSLLIALIVAVGGAIFEAVTGFVTITLMPDIVFIIVNTIFLTKANSTGKKIGIGIGYLNLIIVIIVSVITFFIALNLLTIIGWYRICPSCNLSLGF